ncbi:hypothetical protein GCM10020001_037320 [Nonomuraea salmonea]
MPARAGPTTRARLKMELLSAIALGRSLRPTISTTNACRVGTSTQEIMPSRNAITYTCHTWALPVIVRMPMVSASPAMRVWAPMRMGRLG